MHIEKLTITGADESVNPKDLLDLTKRFKFVEWGILLSKSSEGKKPCFPGIDWMHEFLVTKIKFEAENDKKFSASCHVCGEWARDIIGGGNLFLEDCGCWLDRFQRIQINTAGKTVVYNDEGYVANLKKITSHPLYKTRSVIVQIDGYNDRLYGVCCRAGLPVFPLFDYSYGTGKLTNWHEPYVTCNNFRGNLGDIRFHQSYFGYAGGLNTDNLQEQIKAIEKVVDSCRPTTTTIWLDLQSGVRSNDGKTFDLDKVKSCLEIVESARESL